MSTFSFVSQTTQTWLTAVGRRSGCCCSFLLSSPFISRSLPLRLFFIDFLPTEKNAMQVDFSVCFWVTCGSSRRGKALLRLGPGVPLRLRQAFPHQSSGVDYSCPEGWGLFGWNPKESVQSGTYLVSASPWRSCFQHTWAWFPSRVLRWWRAALHICSEALDCRWSPGVQENNKGSSLLITK